MTAGTDENPVTGPADSLEVRWILPGPLPAAVRDWFGRFPAEAEAREDTYPLQPQLRGLSVKLRDGSVLDVKYYLGSPAIPSLPIRGRLEFWRKWSFPYQPPGQAEAPPAGWVTVRKQRRNSWFPLALGQNPAPAPELATQAGCAVELTQFHAHHHPWWTVGFEATGPAGLLRPSLQHAADMVFAQPLPAGIELGPDNSRSYAQWLSQRPGPAGED
jgi:hypothetical protein